MIDSGTDSRLSQYPSSIHGDLQNAFRVVPFRRNSRQYGSRARRNRRRAASLYILTLTHTPLEPAECAFRVLHERFTLTRDRSRGVRMRVLKWNVFGLAVLLLLLLPPSVVAQEPAPVTRENTVTYEQLLANREAAGEVGTDPQYVIVDLPQQSEVRVANVSYHERYGTMDIYYPPDFDFESSVPAVVFPNYYPDSQYKSGFGVTFRQSRLASDWASLLAASGMAAIVYDTGQPYFSGRAALDFVAAHAGALRIDTGRLGFFAASADVQTAMQLLSKSDIDAVSGVQACVFSYPTTFSGYVPAGSPEVLVVRAGMDRDEFLRNTDNGVERLRDRGHNVTVLEYEEGKHAFDVVQDTERSREVIHEIIAFLKAELER